MNSFGVLHVDSASEYRGGQNQARLLMRGLRDTAEVRQGLVAARGSRLLAETEELGIETFPVRWEFAIDPRPVVRLTRVLRTGWELVHAHDSHGLQSVLAARTLVGRHVPVIASRRVSVPMRTPAVWKRADAVIAVSDDVRGTLLGQGIPPSKVFVIPDGIARNEVSSSLPGRLRDAAGVGPDVAFVGAIGALTPEKGHAWFLRAVAIAAERSPQTRFAIFGEGPERGRLEGIVQELGLRDRVTLPGRIEEIGRSLTDLDLFVMPSLDEGLGTVAVEAMMSGCPLVVSSAGGLPELAGNLIPTVEPGDFESLAREMVRLLADPEARRSLSDFARERADLFTDDQMTSQTLDVYRAALTVERNSQ